MEVSQYPMTTSESSHRIHLFAADNLKKAQTATSVLYDANLYDLKPQDVLSAFEGDPRLVIIKEGEWRLPLTRLAAQHKLSKSRGENRDQSKG